MRFLLSLKLKCNLKPSRSEPRNVLVMISFTPHFASNVGTRSVATITKSFCWFFRTFPTIFFLLLGDADSSSEDDCTSTTEYWSFAFTATAESYTRRKVTKCLYSIQIRKTTQRKYKVGCISAAESNIRMHFFITLLTSISRNSPWCSCPYCQAHIRHKLFQKACFHSANQFEDSIYASWDMTLRILHVKEDTGGTYIRQPR